MRSVLNPGSTRYPWRSTFEPEKLLLTKWTAVTPRDREIFVVVRGIEPQLIDARQAGELEAVHSTQVYLLRS
jgi:hypothetical protein